MAGGVALNSVANTKLFADAGFENIFIQPASMFFSVPGNKRYGSIFPEKFNNRINLFVLNVKFFCNSNRYIHNCLKN